MASLDLPAVLDFVLAGLAIVYLVAWPLVRYWKRLGRRSEGARES